MCTSCLVFVKDDRTFPVEFTGTVHPHVASFFSFLKYAIDWAKFLVGWFDVYGEEVLSELRNTVPEGAHGDGVVIVGPTYQIRYGGGKTSGGEVRRV